MARNSASALAGRRAAKREPPKATRTHAGALARIATRCQKALPCFALSVLPLFCLVQILWGGSLLAGSDTTLWFYPFRLHTSGLLRRGHLPQWNPYLFGGAPLSGNTQVALFYPPNLLLLFMPADRAITLTLVVHLFLAGCLMRFWMRSLGLSEWGGTLSGIVYQFSGFQTARLAAGHVSLTCAMTWIPLLFYLVQQTFTKRDGRWALGSGAVFAVQMLAGHPGITFCTALAMAAYGLFYVVSNRAGNCVVIPESTPKDATSASRQGGFRRGHSKAAPIEVRPASDNQPPPPETRFSSVLHLFDLTTLAVICAAPLAAVQLLPLLDVSQQSTRSAGTTFEFATGFSLPPENLLAFFVPAFFGDGRSAPYWGRWLGWELIGYVGILPIVLAVIALMLRPSRLTRFLLFLAAAALLLSMGRYLPGYQWLYQHVPGLSLFRAPARMLVLWTLSVAALAGIGLDTIRLRAAQGHQGTTESSERVRLVLRWLAWLWAIALVAVLLACYQEEGNSIFWKLVTGYFLGLGTPDERLSHLHRFNQEFLMDTFSVAREGCLTFLIVLAVVLAWLSLHSRLDRTLYLNLWLIGAILLVAVDLWLYGYRNIQGLDPKTLGWDKQTVAFLKQQGEKEQFRVVNLTKQGGENIGLLHGVAMAGGYDPLIPARFAEYANVSEGRAKDEPIVLASFAKAFGGHAHHSRLANLLGIKYVVTDKDTELEDSRLELVKSTDATSVYQNTETYPRAWIAPQWKAIREGPAMLHELAHGQTDLHQVALVEEEIGPESFNFSARDVRGVKSAAEGCRILRYHAERVVIGAVSRTQGLVVLADAFAPGWKAFVDGKETPILRVDYLFRAVPIPPGKHQVEFTYQAPGLRLGGTISAVSWLVLLAWCVLALRRNRTRA